MGITPAEADDRPAAELDWLLAIHEEVSAAQRADERIGSV